MDDSRRNYSQHPFSSNALTPTDISKGEHILNRDIDVKFRRAQEVPDSLRNQIVQICVAHDYVEACFLLDVIEPATGEVKLFISLKLDAPTKLGEIAPLIQQVLLEYPKYNNRVFISRDIFGDLNADYSAYVRASG